MTTSNSSAYRRTIEGLLCLHRYTVAHRDQTEEYHNLCESLEVYWDQMSVDERARAEGLSEDLYTVSDPVPTKLAPLTEPAHVTLGEVYEALKHKNWDTALSRLRKFDRIVPAALVAKLRGTIWSGLGEQPVAAVFLEHALQLAPEDTRQSLQEAK